MRIVFLGTPEFAVPVLEALWAAGHAVVGVVTRPDTPAGRGQRVVAPPVKTAAELRGVLVLQPASWRRRETAQELAALRPQVMVAAAYGRILPPTVLAIPSLGTVNVHPSLLPRYRGPSPVVTALLDGVSVTGVTLYLMDAGMDTGPLLAQQEEAVASDDTTESLTGRLFERGAGMLAAALDALERGTVHPVAQREEEATATRLVTKEDGELDWSLPAVALERRLRAYHPWPGCFTRWRGRALRIAQGAVLPGHAPADGLPGRVVPTEDAAHPLAVVTGEGVLGVRALQVEGRRRQSAAEFLRGYPEFVGSRLPS